MSSAIKVVALVLIVVALALGAGAFALSRSQPPAAPAVAQTPPSPVVETPRTVAVVVAAKPVAAGQALALEDVTTAQWNTLPGGGFSQPNELVGKTLKYPLAAGEAITAHQLATGLSVQLQEGERAVAIAVDEVSSAGNQLQAGDWVDVFFTLPQGKSNDESSQSRLLLPRVRVLAYGEDSLGGTPASSGAGQKAGTRPGSSQNPRTAVLAVPLSSVNDLLLAAGHGAVRLAMRHPEDTNAPGIALFPTPPSVLQARRGLSEQERMQLESPDNLAYAGRNLPALADPADTQAAKPATPAPAARRPAPARASAGNDIQVVRGTAMQSVSY